MIQSTRTHTEELDESLDFRSANARESWHALGCPEPSDEDYDRMIAQDAISVDRYALMFGENTTDPTTVMYRAAKARIAKREEEVSVLQQFREEMPHLENIPPDPVESQWDPKKEYALELVLAGMSVTEVAINADVSRRTIHRWMQDDQFRAIMAKRKQELAVDLHTEIPALMQDAFEALDASLRQGSPNAAFSALKSLGILDGSLFFGKDDALVRELLGLPASEEAGGTREEKPKAESGKPEGEESEQASDVRQVGHGEQKATEQEERKEELRKISQLWDEAMGHVRHAAGLSSQENESVSNIESGFSLLELMNITPSSLVAWRETVEKPEFQQALGTARMRLETYWRFRSQHIARLAIASLRRELQNRNGQLAVRVLKGLGVLKK